MQIGTSTGCKLWIAAPVTKSYTVPNIKAGAQTQTNLLQDFFPPTALNVRRPAQRGAFAFPLTAHIDAHPHPPSPRDLRSSRGEGLCPEANGYDETGCVAGIRRTCHGASVLFADNVLNTRPPCRYMDACGVFGFVRNMPSPFDDRREHRKSGERPG